MFCENCGNQIGPDEKFCSVCGKRAPEEEIAKTPLTEDVAETSESEVVEDTPETTVETETSAEVESTEETVSDSVIVDESSAEYVFEPAPSSPKNFKPLAIIAAIILAAVVVFASPIDNIIGNSLCKLFMSPEGYFKHVVKSNLKDETSSIASMVTDILDNVSPDNSVDGNVKVSVGDGLVPLLEDLGAYGADEYIDWLKSGEIDYTATVNGNKISADYDLKLNGKDITDASVVADLEDGIYMGLPALNKTYLYMDLNDAGIYMPSDSMEELNEFLKAVPSERLIKKIANRYVATAVKQIDDVEESSTTVEADGISQKCTQLSVTIDGETVANVSEAVLTELQDDKEIKKIITNFCETELVSADADEVYDEFTEAIDYALDDLSYMEDYFEDFTVDFYINNKGDIIGFEFDEDGVRFSAVVAEKGNKFGVCVEFDSYGENIKFEGSGKGSSKKRTGEYYISYNKAELIKISTKKLNTNLLKEGVINGSISVEAADGIKSMLRLSGQEELEVLGGLKLVINSKSKTMDKANTSVELYYDDNLCLSLESSAKVNNAKKVSIPKNYVDASDYDEIESWASDFNVDKLIDRLEKANVPSEWIDMIEEAFDNI